MKYKEELARSLQAQHGIPGSTLRTWKRRGEIPDRYFEEGPRAQADKEKMKNLLACLGHPALNRTLICQRAGVPMQTTVDVLRYDYTMSIQEVQQLREALTALANELRAIRSENTLLAVLKSGALKLRPALRETLDKTQLERLYCWRRGKCHLPGDLYEAVKKRLVGIAGEIKPR